MYRLISFLSTYRNVILFFFLEVISFRMLVRYNDHQRHQFGDRMFEVAGTVQELRNGVQDFQRRAVDYDQRVAEIDSLFEVVDSLRNLVTAYKIHTGADSADSIRNFFEESRTNEDFRYIPCRVVRNTVDNLYNYITIDKGRKDSVEVDMGVVSPTGVVGRVIRVSEHYSLVLSALNVSFKLSLQTMSGDTLGESIGVYEWDGRKTSEARLTYIPGSVELALGTNVVTSGFSTIFPAGYPVGKVKNVIEGGEDGFYDATIQLSTDFHRLGTVFVIRSLHKAEIDSLYQSIPAP
ncbi:MAG: rod shape-determining protein MreC [Bacteroidia bacterium]|nr:rod shape-determining protein MreC [Bacteroidia bacterium]